MQSLPCPTANAPFTLSNCGFSVEPTVLTIALTGGIGSGKTTVANRFAALGIPVIDADVLSRELVKPQQPAYQEIIDVFGTGILDADGNIDRAALRDRVFSEPTLRVRLEGILHPRVYEAMRIRMERIEAPFVVLVVPLLLESGHGKIADRILVVDAPQEDQIRRVIQRNGLSEEEVLRIIAAQWDRNRRLAAADDVIDNSGDLEYLLAQADQFHKMYLSLVEAGGPLDHAAG